MLKSILGKLSAKRKINASALILAHNHPSGCAEPSKADKLITERIIKSCQFMDLRVLDHIVIGRGEYVSLPNAAGFNPLCAILRDLCLFGT